MKIDELIADLEEIADGAAVDARLYTGMTCRKAAEVIKLLWEVAKDTTNEKYKRQIDEWSGNNDTQNAD